MHSSMAPFGEFPGRDLARDRPPGFDVADYYYDQRSQVAGDAAILRRLIGAVASPNELTSYQWAQWYSVALGFAPDVILELGRGRGNSTALFTQAAARLGGTKVVSLCRSPDWTSMTRPKIERIVDPAWFRNLETRTTDILTADYEEILRGHRRPLVLWDAHGFEIAEVVLGGILPLLADRPHLILIHDIIDNRHAGVPRSYGGLPLWKGSHWQSETRSWDSRVNIGWMNSIQDQVISLADFAARNDLEIGSADHEYARFFGTSPDRSDEMRALLGDEFFQVTAHWAFLSLTGKQGPFHFPGVTGRLQFADRCEVASEQW